MKKQTNMNILIRSSFALTLALTIWSPVQSQAAEHAEGKQMMEGKMMERCEAMKEQKQKMKAEMEAQDAELTEQVAEMNRAPEAQKVDLMAAVITRMAEQRTAMHARKTMMEEAKMQHMMQHMQQGKESMAQCPMMKGMKGMDEESAGDHEEH